MENFLARLAGVIDTQYGGDYRRLCVVLPNRRAGLYLKYLLARKTTHPVWAPSVFASEDFVFALCPYQKTELYDDLLLLYQASRQVEGFSNRSFDEFLEWGQVVLGDFNEVDTHLVDAGVLFRYLNDVKVYTLWGQNNDELTDFQKKYLAFYASLGDLYAEFYRLQESAGMVTAGMAYRWVASHVATAGLFGQWDHFIFAGFNALNPAESAIMEFLKKEGKASVFYDAEIDWLEDDMAEAGDFLRGKIKAGQDFWVDDALRQQERDLHILGGPGLVGMVKLLGQTIATKCQAEGNEWLSRAAVVLPDEKLLIPVLRALPPECGEMNITMGLPLSETPIAALVSAFFRVILSRSADGFHVPQLLEFLRHPYIGLYLSDENPTLQSRVTTMQETGRMVASGKDIADSLFNESQAGQKLMTILSRESSPATTLAFLLDIADLVVPVLRGSVHEEYLYLMSRAVSGIIAKMNGFKIDAGFETLQNLLAQLINRTRMPFYGEPLKGLQVMGMLETRSLDFEYVFMLPANDDVLPGSGRHPSFIPHDVRIEEGFGLPVYKHRNSVMAYHFFRLMKRCREAWFFYNTGTEGMGKGELSRFLMQMQYESAWKNSRNRFTHKVITAQTLVPAPESLVFSKSSFVIGEISMMAASGFSPSALWTYNLCGVKFFFDYMLGMRKYRDPGRGIDAAVFGSAVHDVLSGMYQAKPPLRVNSAILEDAYRNAGDLLQAAFRRQICEIDLSSGKNLLMMNVGRQLLQMYIQYEKNLIAADHKVLEIRSAEEEFSGTLNLPAGSQVSIRGRIDRIDNINGQLRIIDFKTGAVRPEDLIWDTDKPMKGNPRAEKPFQLLVYKWLYLINHPMSRPEAGIYSLKRPSNGFMPVSLKQNQDETEFITAELIKLINELFDPEQPFERVHDDKACFYCNYKFICNRA